ncbi:MAG TPA: response regulator, partial [Candidatus Binatus sp.]|nr:response regulator [Candidatus Binatus sp.]
RHLVELHGGTIVAESPGDGKGTTFRITLPLETSAPPEQAPPEADRTTASPEEADLRGVRVLIVDDDPDARELMATILAACGAEVSLAASAMEALDVLQLGTPDVFISDIAMPDADGYALLRRIRAPDTGDRGLVPAIAVTAHAGPTGRRHALAAGYQLHLGKPFEPAELVAAVAGLARSGSSGDLAG